MPLMTESIVEDATLEWLEDLGYTLLHGPDIAPGEPDAERNDYGEVFLTTRLRQAFSTLNPNLPAEALDDAFRKLTRIDGSSMVERNRTFHRMLVNGVPVEYRRSDGSIAGAQAKVIDFENPKNNDWLAINQFTVVEDKHNRRPDVVIFINGLPLAVMELKNAAEEKATIWTAFNQLQTYKKQIPSLFTANAFLIISDGLQARIGSLTADRERFMPWRTVEGQELAKTSLPELQVMVQGVFQQQRFLDLLRYFVVFEDVQGTGLVKKLAGYHQFHAVNAALKETLRAADQNTGDRRVGVVWHTQGSGKSLTMALRGITLLYLPEKILW